MNSSWHINSSHMILSGNDYQEIKSFIYSHNMQQFLFIFKFFAFLGWCDFQTFFEQY